MELSLRERKILIVEDDLASRLYLNKILERTGAVLFNAGDGQLAFDTVLKNPDIEIVLMDIQLPVLDGYGATAKIRDLGRKIIIVAQTAFGMSEHYEKIKNSGFDDIIIKPVFSQKLIEKLLSLLKKE